VFDGETLSSDLERAPKVDNLPLSSKNREKEVMSSMNDHNLSSVALKQYEEQLVHGSIPEQVHGSCSRNAQDSLLADNSEQRPLQF